MKWNKKKVKQRQKKKLLKEWRSSFIHFNKNSMKWKRAVFATELHCTFACVSVCLSQMAIIYLFFVPFMLYSMNIQRKSKNKTKQKNERQLTHIKRKKRWIYYLFRLFLQLVTKEYQNDVTCDALKRCFQAIVVFFFRCFLRLFYKNVNTTLEQ